MLCFCLYVILFSFYTVLSNIKIMGPIISVHAGAIPISGGHTNFSGGIFPTAPTQKKLISVSI